MRNARARQNAHRDREPTGASAVSRRATQFPPMKKTLLFTTLLAGLALVGCNKSTRTSTAATSPSAADQNPSSTASSTPSSSSSSASSSLANAANSASNAIGSAV